MATIPSRARDARSREQVATAIFVALVWIGLLSGFGTVSARHISARGFDYPLIVHVHALTFVTWLCLFTTQMLLVHRRRVDLHRRLGIAGVALACWMMIIGPATAIVQDAARYAATGQTPEFLAVQLGDMLGFGVLTAAALWMRRDPLAHKRLMLLSLLTLSGAGFGRFLNDFAAAPLGQTWYGAYVGLNFGTQMLLIAIGIYDYAARGRLHPAYVCGAGFMIAVHVTACALLFSERWKAISLWMVGAG